MPDSTALAQALLLNLRRRVSPEESQRKYGEAIMQQGAQTTPVRSPLEALARALQGGVGGFFAGQADRDEKAADTASNDFLTRAAGAGSQADLDNVLKTAPKSNNDVIAPLLATMIANKQQQWQLGARADGVVGSYGQVPGGGVPQTAGTIAQPGYQATLAPMESGNDPQIVNPKSGAAGTFQFLPATWADTRAKNPNLNLPATVAQASPQQQSQAEEAFRANNAAELQKAGIPPTPANLYLAHRAGAQGAQAILGASPDAPLSTVVPPEWIAANPDMKTTVGQFVANANQRFGDGQGGQPQGPQMAQAAPQGGPIGSADASGTPQPPQGTPSSLQAPAVPNIPRPQPTQQQLMQLRQQIISGIPEANAKQGLEAQLDRDWQVQRERAKMSFDQQNQSFQAQQKQQLDQPQENLTNEAKLRNEFQGLQTTKDYRKAAATFKDAVEASKGGTKASDLNMVYAFATMMDPGSVVREGEMVMVNGTSSMSDRLRGLVNGLQGGATLSPETRQALLSEMAHRYEAYKGVHDQTADQFGQIALRSGMDSRNIIAPLPPVEYQRAPTGAPKPGDVMQGHRFKGGNPADQANWEKVQ